MIFKMVKKINRKNIIQDKQGEEPDFKIWIAGAPTSYGGIDYYLVPKGVLEEGYDDVGDYVNQVEEDLVPSSQMLGYDYSLVHKALSGGQPKSMLEEACRFTHHLRTRILYNGRIDGVGMGQGLRFLKEYLGYIVFSL